MCPPTHWGHYGIVKWKAAKKSIKPFTVADSVLFSSCSSSHRWWCEQNCCLVQHEWLIRLLILRGFMTCRNLSLSWPDNSRACPKAHENCKTREKIALAISFSVYFSATLKQLRILLWSWKIFETFSLNALKSEKYLNGFVIMRRLMPNHWRKTHSSCEFAIRVEEELKVVHGGALCASAKQKVEF